MTRRAAVSLMATAAIAVSTIASLRAHEGHDHKILGTVTMAATDHVMLKDTDAKDVTVQVTKETKVVSKPAMKVQDIKAGTRVVITATEGKDKTFTAKTIEVGAVSSKQ